MGSQDDMRVSEAPREDVEDSFNKDITQDGDEAGKVSKSKIKWLQLISPINTVLKFLRDYDVRVIASSATEEDYAKIVRKLDWRILPLLFGTYALQCIDKSALGYAAAFTLSTDLGLVGKQ